MNASAQNHRLSDPLNMVAEIVRRKKHGRFVVAIVGAPGSGKSTLSDQIRDILVARHGVSAEIVPMDGFHYDNAVLDQRGHRAVKGSPRTFDVDGFGDLLGRLKANHADEVAIPVFDRENDLSRASARIVQKGVEILLVEGNYLLLYEKPWERLCQYFDLTVKIECPREVLAQRLMRRWLDLGVSQEAAHRKVESNDLPNADVVDLRSRPADIVFSSAS
jgi:pantothenate kinase